MTKNEAVERLARIQAWCDAYPVEVFPDIDLTSARTALGDDVMFSRLHAAWARHLLAGISAIAKGEK